MAKLLIGVALIAVIIIGVIVIFPKKGEYDAPRPKNDSAFNDTSEEPTIKLKSIGINLDYYDSKTNTAGNVKFTDQRYSFMPPFEEYGNWIDDNGRKYRNVQASFRVPEGTKILAPIDGFVYDVPKLYSGDYSVNIIPSMESRWQYGVEHVENPVVKPGDFVKAGQVVAVASTRKDNNGWAFYELGLGKGTQNNDERPSGLCPFAYLDDSIKEETLKKIKALMLSWEEYRNNPEEYDENATSIPGCQTLEEVEG